MQGQPVCQTPHADGTPAWGNLTQELGRRPRKRAEHFPFLAGGRREGWQGASAVVLSLRLWAPSVSTLIAGGFTPGFRFLAPPGPGRTLKAGRGRCLGPAGRGRTALHCAASGGHLECLRLLLDIGLDKAPAGGSRAWWANRARMDFLLSKHSGVSTQLNYSETDTLFMAWKGLEMPDAQKLSSAQIATGPPCTA